jgi:hypothetical protein
MQRYTRVKAEAPSSDHGLAIVVDAELFRLEGVVRWLDATDARLRMREVPAVDLIVEQSTSETVAAGE